MKRTRLLLGLVLALVMLLTIVPPGAAQCIPKWIPPNILKSVDQGPYVVGDSVTFTIVTYNSTDPVCENNFYNMRLVDILDPVFRIDNASSTMGSVTISGQMVIVDSGIALAGGEFFRTTINCTIVSGAGREVVNDAVVEHTDADGSPMPPVDSEEPVVIAIGEASPVVPEASTLILLGGAATGLAGFVGLQIKVRRRDRR